ncbi:MAG: hypothetical protein ABJO02_13155 [Reichenbachiella sp.]|uniref:hypothetical protein n=1 Tax=Reichenbachiella sp. TaxID=2184521 RepID=UPI003298789B
MKNKSMWYGFFFLALLSACKTDTATPQVNGQAETNAKQAQEAFSRSKQYLEAWWMVRDSASGLIPQNLTAEADIWNPHNSAADNQAFMVLTASLLDEDLYHGPMKEDLRREVELTARILSLSDEFRFSTQSFSRAEVDTSKIIFGASEYMKDGLMPLLEYIGASPWQERMLQMLDDLSGLVRVAKKIEGNYLGNAPIEEVNGELLQVLTRTYWMTGNEAYLDWAIDIGDYYLLGERDILQFEKFRLRDHGCEIVGGLSELYATVHFARPEKKEKYQTAYYKLLDRILEIGTNEHGMFYDEINLKSGEVIQERLVDGFGYLYNAYYTVYVIDHYQPYKQAVEAALDNLRLYTNFRWQAESADGYADAIESAINLYNRLPKPALAAWIDSEMLVMWSKQQENGMIEAWHGDGNFARTSLMYGLMKTQGATIHPWKANVALGAVRSAQGLYVYISADEGWKGTLKFESARHQSHLKMPLDYPRINQFPEWYPIQSDEQYEMMTEGKDSRKKVKGSQLIEGIKVDVPKGSAVRMVIKKIPENPPV